ncbi:MULTISPECIES: chemotaxis protein CheA [Methylosinus]|uniref:Chemotaxis protein CheA n=1 Tax=Methylosinus trichosporium (strain ATCC 35070 / NCIMB 11131 / UNIQEM 75 / OB3b) TaxID=595536 RepID=A0A2D2CZT4_METT3|nr:MULTISPECIES: chemotaxis protein CheA [Methylosinus]ATQ68139.1 chemotaxis protein CheA [Methylosinus trichosporium OB3b]OBS53526.1 chemotaxis protein CheA [Methylosinus sp. 3S-1]
MNDAEKAFREEADDLLEQLEQSLLDLEKTPSDNELIACAFRALHTLKGSGAMFGYEKVSAFVHNFETAFDHVRKGRAPPSTELVSVALLAKDHVRAQIEDPEAADEATGRRILDELRRVVEASAPVAAEAPAVEIAAPARPARAAWRLRFSFDERVLVNGTNPLLLFDELRTLGELDLRACADAVPSLDAIDPTVCYLSFEATLVTDAPRSAIEDVFIFVIDEMSLEIERVDEEQSTHVEEAPPAAAEAAPTATRRSAENEGRGAGSVRVQAEKVDELMDRVGELVIAQARLTQLAETASLDIKAIAEEIERLAANLRDVTMGIRMVPIGSLFGRYRRLVHDLSSELDKPVDLVMSGEETELDKTMIERLADPLVHLIRNSLDHGLEDVAGRAAAGKAATGRIRLSASHSGAEVLITVADDGRGLDVARIRAKAVANGLIAEDAVMSDAEIHQLIFHAGFSTAQSITKLSGRGVGMDVVKRTIEGLRGAIDIASTPGGGSEVTLRLPLTLAIIEGLLVRVGAARYVIPLSSVEECVELATAGEGGSAGRSFLNIRGDLVPFLRLREFLSAKTPPDPHQKVVVVSFGDQRVGLVVDQIIGSHQTVIKSLSKLHADVPCFSGATILGDGAVALIFDIPHLVDRGQAHDEERKAREKEAA